MRQDDDIQIVNLLFARQESGLKKLEEKYNANIILLNVANIDISSSMIRERLEEGKRVDFFLPNKVLKYIVDNRLYEGDLND